MSFGLNTISSTYCTVLYSIARLGDGDAYFASTPNVFWWEAKDDDRGSSNPFRDQKLTYNCPLLILSEWNPFELVKSRSDKSHQRDAPQINLNLNRNVNNWLDLYQPCDFPYDKGQIRENRIRYWTNHQAELPFS